MNKNREQFYEKNKTITENKFELEMLYSQKKQYENLESIRSNSSKIVWFIIVQILIGFIYIIFVTGQFN